MKITLPTSWKEVSILQYKKLINIKAKTAYDRTCKVLSVLTNREDNYYINMPNDIVIKLASKTKFIEVPPNNKCKINEFYKIKERKYKFNYDVTKLSYVQGVDISNLSAKDKYEVLDTLHLFIATIFSPIERKGLLKKDYILKHGEYDVKEHAEFILNNMNIEDAISVNLFFCTVLIQSLPVSLEAMMKKMNSETLTFQEQQWMQKMTVLVKKIKGSFGMV